MLENLTSQVKQFAGDAIINNPAIPTERNDEAVSTASHSIIDGLKNAVAGGNTAEVMNMFNSGGDTVSNSAVTQNIQGGFVDNLVHKFGLDKGKAGQIAGSLIPMVMKNFAQKTKDPNDNSFNLQDVIGNLTGGKGMDMLKNITGGDGKEGGGLMDKVKGMFN
jgi:hypothetical protein